MKTFAVCLSFVLLISCSAGYQRIRYAEMPVPPNVTLKGKELIVTTRNEDGEGLSVYKVDINIHDRSQIVELRGFQSIRKSEKTKFIIPLSKDALARISEYGVYWIDPGGKKTRIVVSDKL